MATEEKVEGEKAASKADANDANASKTDTNVSSGEANAKPTRERKKRKWDQPSQPVVSAVVSPTVSMVQQCAAAIVQKINQELVKKVLLPQAKIQGEVIAREIVINDAEQGIRHKLTKRQTQEEIQMRTGAIAITRGKYKPPNGPIDHEKPLHLHISAGAHLKDTAARIKAVDQAAAIVEEIINQGRQAPYPPATQQSSAMINPPLTAAVFLGFEPDPSMDVTTRIRGPNDQHINHIMNETGAAVVLKGRVSNKLEGASGEELPQPLHLSISADNPKSRDNARRLAENLMETIRSEFLGSKFPPYSQPGTSYNSQEILPPYQASSYAAKHTTSVVPGSYGEYYPYSLTQIPSLLSSVGSLTESAVALDQADRFSPYLQHDTSYNVQQILPPYQASSYAAKQTTSLVPGSYGGYDPYSVPQLSSRLPSGGFLTQPAVAADQTDMSFSSKVYSAVPPPKQLLAADQSTVKSDSQSQSGQPGYPALSLLHGTAAVAQQSLTSLGLGYGQPVAASYPQASQLQPQHSVDSSATLTSYSVYSGIYPQATPLQQVALALQRPPPPVSTKPSFVALESTASRKDQNNLSQGHGEKPERQQRKFQEFPVAGKDPSRADQVFSVISPSVKGMMPQPPLFSPKLSSLASIESSAKKGLKLMEYRGDDNDDTTIGRKEAASYYNGKPFWAP